MHAQSCGPLDPQHGRKASVEVHAHDISTLEIEPGGSGIQNHLWWLWVVQGQYELHEVLLKTVNKTKNIRDNSLTRGLHSFLLEARSVV